MKKTMFIITFREIKNTLNRFIAIVTIVAIGTAFYSGLNAVGPNMVASISKYYSDYQFMDYKIVSTIGFDEDDVKSIKSLNNVKGVMPAYSMDAIQTYGEAASKQTNVTHLISITDDGEKNSDDNNINRLKVINGRLPEKSGECVVDTQTINKVANIGDIIKLSSGTEDDISQKLHTTEYKVVGIVETPAYLTRDRGTSKIGNGKVSSLMFIPEKDFNIPAYTEIYTTVKGAEMLKSFSDEYNNKVSPFENELNNISSQRIKTRYDEIVNDANNELSNKHKEYEDAKSQQESSLSEANNKINDTEKQIADAQRELNEKKLESDKKFTDTQNQIDGTEKQLVASKNQYDANLTDYNQAAATAQPQLDAAKQQIDSLNAEIASKESQLNSLKKQLSEGTASGTMTNEQITQLNTNISQLENVIAALKQQQTNAQAQLDLQNKKLSDSKSQLSAAKSQLDSSYEQLNSKKKTFEETKADANNQFTEKQNSIDDSKNKLNEARTDYEKEKSDSDKKLKDAEQNINDAKQKISDIAMPEWHIFSRTDNAGYNDYNGTIDRNNGLASILPIFFFTIAALVCLTTMTRMVDEQRSQIGTLKALGYGNASIAFKYIFYAAFASILGSVIGIAIGFTLIPSVIFKAYEPLYSMPAIKLMFHTGYAVLAFAIVTIVTTTATFFTCYKELRILPSSLLRPKAPKAGKRILLERINFIWKHMSFSKKVTARNLFRYKKRFWMTVLGVAGCTAMLIGGLGLKDSIATQVSEKQFGQIWKYDMSIQIKNDLNSDQKKTITDDINGNSQISSFAELTYKNVSVAVNGKDEEVNMMIPTDSEKFSQFITLQTPDTKKSITLSNTGVVLTEKLAKILKVQVGDTITVKDDDSKSHSFKIDNIAENYLQHFIFMSPESYKKVYGENPNTNQFLAGLKDTTSNSQEAISSSLMKIDGVSSIRFTTDNKKGFNDILGSLNYFIWVIILSAAVLAFVVLYTLTTINISERFNEIATIKVLGFYDKEVSTYIYRESYILTFFGALIGLLSGVYLHSYILASAEVDTIMYVKQILPQSFIISGLLAFVFTWIVNKMSIYRLRNINMVEALKGNE